jgi:F0F1-type ATP synthase beta subunit
MSATEGLKRGMEITDMGAPISVPVGEDAMGRVFDVTGNAVDEQGPVKADKFLPIHRAAPPLVDQSTSPQILTTGFKVIAHWIVPVRVYFGSGAEMCHYLSFSLFDAFAGGMLP